MRTYLIKIVLVLTLFNLLEFGMLKFAGLFLSFVVAQKNVDTQSAVAPLRHSKTDPLGNTLAKKNEEEKKAKTIKIFNDVPPPTISNDLSTPASTPVPAPRPTSATTRLIPVSTPRHIPASTARPTLARAPVRTAASTPIPTSARASIRTPNHTPASPPRHKSNPVKPQEPSSTQAHSSSPISDQMPPTSLESDRVSAEVVLTPSGPKTFPDVNSAESDEENKIPTVGIFACIAAAAVVSLVAFGWHKSKKEEPSNGEFDNTGRGMAFDPNLTKAKTRNNYTRSTSSLMFEDVNAQASSRIKEGLAVQTISETNFEHDSAADTVVRHGHGEFEVYEIA